MTKNIGLWEDFFIKDKEQKETRNPGTQPLQRQKAGADQLVARRELESHHLSHIYL